MKLSEIKPLAEHNKGRHAQPIAQTKLQSWLVNADRLDGVVGGQSSSDDYAHVYSLFKHEFDPRNIAVILTPRTEQSRPVGYFILTKSGKYWQVLDVWLEPSERNKKIGVNFYLSVSALGYKLISGDSLTDEAERLWMSLGREKRALVIDTQTDQVEPFSNKPIGDGDVVAGKVPRYRWITEGTGLHTFIHRGGPRSLAEGRDAYLSGATNEQAFKIIGIVPIMVESAEPLAKAGFMPYVIEHGEPVFLFMKSSDPNYGGPDPAIAKGGIDDGETSLEAALREGREELGLLPSNIVEGTIKKVFNDTVTGTKESYNLTVFIGQVKNRARFGKFHYETASTHWLTTAQFAEQGTQHQLPIVKKAAKLVRDNL